MMRAASFALLGLTAVACNTPVGSFSPPPGPQAEPAPLVVGRWMLEASPTGEHLWIESDGTFTEAGGPEPFALGSLAGILSTGTWTFTDPRLTFDDDQTGPHVFGTVIQQFGALLTLESNRSFVFERESVPDGSYQP